MLPRRRVPIGVAYVAALDESDASAELPRHGRGDRWQPTVVWWRGVPARPPPERPGLVAQRSAHASRSSRFCRSRCLPAGGATVQPGPPVSVARSRTSRTRTYRASRFLSAAAPCGQRRVYCKPSRVAAAAVTGTYLHNET